MIEGHAIAFNGTHGRMELRQFEKQPWETPDHDEILLVRSYGQGVETIQAPHAGGGHFGGDDRMRNTILRNGEDPLGQRAGSRAGAMSVMVGLAAFESARSGRTVNIAEFGEI